MTVKDLYLGTMKFVWLKLALGAAITLASLILLALFSLIGSLFGEGGLFFMFLFWLGLSGGIYSFVMHYVGYMIKAGHVAVIAEAVTSGRIPEDQFNWGVEAVKSRFATSNVYFVIDRLVSGAVRQLQNAIEKLDGLLDFIPGISTLTGVVSVFIRVALGTVDECCLGYCFLHKEEGAFKASCDGVVIYYQNGKLLLKNAIKTTLIVILGTVLAFLLPMLIFGLIFRALGWSTVAAVVLALFVAVTVRSAFIDSYILVDMMTAYMKAAPETEITFDLYDKLSKLSFQFKKLLGKAQEEQVVQPETEF